MQSIAKLSEFAGHLRSLIRATSNAETVWADNSFGELASTLFELQRELNGPYRTLCLAGAKVENPKPQNWKDIPAVPTSAFKDLELSCLPTNDRTTVFHSSGTTEHRPSRQSLAVYEESLLAWFCTQIQIRQQIPIISLTPPPELAPHSSLVYMFETLGRKFGTDGSMFVGNIGEDGGWTLNFQATLEALRQCTEMERPILILGTAFLHVHLLDYLTENNIRFNLPAGSQVMETGGYKGRSRSIPKDELHHLVCERLGISEANIICEYGMSELSSQAYAHVSHQLRSHRRKEAHFENPNGIPPQSPGLPSLRGYPGIDAANIYNPERVAPSAVHIATRELRFPRWARVQIISPETGHEVNEGETGLIRVFDLANVFSVMAIQTEDLGIRRGDGFELVGRASLAETRGCSLMAI